MVSAPGGQRGRGGRGRGLPRLRRGRGRRILRERGSGGRRGGASEGFPAVILVDVFVQFLPPGKRKRKVRIDGTEIPLAILQKLQLASII